MGRTRYLKHTYAYTIPAENVVLAATYGTPCTFKPPRRCRSGRLTLAVGGPVGAADPPVKVGAADGVDVLGVGAVEQLPLSHAPPAVLLPHLLPLPFQNKQIMRRFE